MTEYLTEQDIETAAKQVMEHDQTAGIGTWEEEHELCRDMARRQARAALEAVLSEIIRRAKQDAWCEGKKAGQENVLAMIQANKQVEEPINPYREAP